MSNFRTSTVDAVFASANTETAIEHGLEEIPHGYITAGKTANGSVYDSTTTWTSNYAYLKASAVGTYRLVFFA